MTKSRYVVDIDETICTRGTCEVCRYEGATPMRERIAVINKLYDEGHHITYFTARGMGRFEGDADKAREKLEPLTKMQLDIWVCKYHQLIMGKPSGDYYIDDKAWPDYIFFNDRR